MQPRAVKHCEKCGFKYTSPRALHRHNCKPRPPEGKQSPCGCQINHVGLYDEEEGIDPTMSTIIYCPMHEAAPKLVAALQAEHEGVIRDVIGGWDGRFHNNGKGCDICALLKEAAK